MGGCMEDTYCVSEANEDTNVRGVARVAYGTVKRRAIRALALAVVVSGARREFAKKQTAKKYGEATRDVSRQNTSLHIVGGASALRRRRDGGPWEGWTGESVAGFRIHVSGGPTHGRNAGAWHASTWPPPGSRTNAYVSPSEAVKPSRAGPDPTTLSRGPLFFRCSDRRTPTTRPRSARHPGSALSVGGPRWRTRAPFPNQTRTTTTRSTSTVRGGARRKAPVRRRPVSAVCCRWRGRTRGG